MDNHGCQHPYQRTKNDGQSCIDSQSRADCTLHSSKIIQRTICGNVLHRSISKTGTENSHTAQNGACQHPNSVLLKPQTMYQKRRRQQHSNGLREVFDDAGRPSSLHSRESRWNSAGQPLACQLPTPIVSVLIEKVYALPKFQIHLNGCAYLITRAPTEFVAQRAPIS